MENRLPNFIIIGAGKSGTTSVYNYMKQHPEIFMCPIKEPRFFAYTGKINNDLQVPHKNSYFPTKTFEEYTSLFKQATNEPIIGEASPIYLTSTVAAERIRKLLPEVKLLAILRNPVDRAFSHYTMLVRGGIESWEAETGFKKDTFKKDSLIVRGGLYYENLMRYFALFSEKQIKICIFEDLKRNTLSVIQDIYAYLGVDPSFKPDVSERYNVGGFPKNQRLGIILLWINKLWNNRSIIYMRDFVPKRFIRMYWALYNKNLDKRIEYPQDLRRLLLEFYREDILKLQDLIRRDLTSWLNV